MKDMILTMTCILLLQLQLLLRENFVKQHESRILARKFTVALGDIN